MLKQTISQKLLQKLSPQQIQLMKLLQVPTMELEQRIKQEIEENPALEEGAEEKDEFDQENEYEEEAADNQDEFDINDYLDDDLPQYKTSVKNKGRDDDDKAVPLSSGKSFSEILLQQLNLKNLTENQQQIAAQLIGNLDDDGYLRRDLIDIVDDLAFSQNITTTEEELEEILFQIQDLEPAGIAARDLRECLLIQLKRKKNETVAAYTAKKIVEDHFESFTKKHYDKITKKLDIGDEDLKEAIEAIVKLNPKPGGSVKDTAKSMQQIIPDFVITERDGKLELTLNAEMHHN